MKISILGTNGLPANYGGFETLANYLVEHLAKDHDVTVYCSKTPKNKRLKIFNNAKLLYFPFKANGWQSILYDCFTILHALCFSKNLIILGFSGAFSFPLNKFFHRNIIFNIGGVEWKKVRGSKLLSHYEVALKKFMERLCVNNSQKIIIDNSSFYDYIVKTYNRIPVLAEYGGDHAFFGNVTDQILSDYPFLNDEFDLSISRAQEDMNIHILIDAYKIVSNRTLVIISNWETTKYGQNLYDMYNNKFKNIILLNAIYNIDILNAIRVKASLYLHSHSLCGTAPSLVEAMYLGLPIIAFDVPANRSTTENQAIFFNNSEDLIFSLKGINSDLLNIIKKKMKTIADKRYFWQRIVGVYKENLI